MALLRALEMIFLCGLVYGFFTQVIIPLYRGTILLPWFRRSSLRKLEEEITTVRQDHYEQGLRNKIAEERNKGTEGD